MQEERLEKVWLENGGAQKGLKGSPGVSNGDPWRYIGSDWGFSGGREGSLGGLGELLGLPGSAHFEPPLETTGLLQHRAY